MPKDLDQLNSDLLSYCPSRSWQIKTVTFPSTANTDLDIPHDLMPADPELVGYMVIQSAQPCMVYHDSSGTRTSWTSGIMRLRCTRKGATVTLLLWLKDKAAGGDFLGTTRENKLSFDSTIGIGGSMDWGTSPAALEGAMVADWTLSQSSGNLSMSSQASGAHATFTFKDFGTTVATIGGTTSTSSSSTSVRGVTIPILNVDTTLYASNGIRERTYLALMGNWTSVTFASGNFTANAGTWTVESGDQVTLAYTLVGKTMTVSFVLTSTTTSAGMGAQLRIAIPGGFTAAKDMWTAIKTIDNGTQAIGLASVSSGLTIIICQLANSANWTSSVTNNTGVSGTISFEVQ